MLAYIDRPAVSAVQLIPALSELYRIVYSEPPYSEGPEQVDRFREGFPDESARPGFMLITAEDEGTLCGAAYGWTMLAGTWWSRSDIDPPAEVLGAEKFAVMEWIVHPRYRGCGIGAELLRRLLSKRSERYATLASDPRSEARAIYARKGWRLVGRSVLPWGPPMDLLILDLRTYRPCEANVDSSRPAGDG